MPPFPLLEELGTSVVESPGVSLPVTFAGRKIFRRPRSNRAAAKLTSCFFAWEGGDLDFIYCIAVNTTGEKGPVTLLHDFKLFPSNFNRNRHPVLLFQRLQNFFLQLILLHVQVSFHSWGMPEHGVL